MREAVTASHTTRRRRRRRVTTMVVEEEEEEADDEVEEPRHRTQRRRPPRRRRLRPPPRTLWMWQSVEEEYTRLLARAEGSTAVVVSGWKPALGRSVRRRAREVRVVASGPTIYL